MEKRTTPADILRSLLSQKNYSLRELDHFYRLLSKRCHPDATGGGTGEEFIKLRRVYEEASSRLLMCSEKSVRTNQFRQSGAPEAPEFGARPPGRQASRFDPLQLVREAGFDHQLPPRGCVYLGLRAFFSSGMHNHRIRTMSGLKRRNTTILRTIFHWSRLYDDDFARIFSAYSRHTLQFLSTTWEIKNYNYAKRLFLDGVHGFFSYQSTGRGGTAEVARDKFSWCSYTLSRVLKIDHPTAPLAEWFTAELDKPAQLREPE